MTQIDEKEIQRWFDVFRSESREVEIRCLRATGGTPVSGYFDNPADIINAIRPYQQEYSVYFTINALAPGLSQRIQWKRLVQGARATKDSEIESRLFVLIDIDPVRPEGICSSEPELHAAETMADTVQQFLCDQGFYRPIRIASGNGVHLYLPCLMKNTDGNRVVIERFLKALDMLFSDSDTHVDTSVSNASRIARLPGCWNRKGSAISTERPQRLCHFVYVPETIMANDIAYFQKVADMYEDDTPEKAYPRTAGESAFDLDAFLDKHGIEVKRRIQTPNGQRLVLKQCPFHPEHGETAAIFHNNDGLITFHCFHNSCQQYRWRDLRLMYEPDAYDRAEFSDYQYRRREWRTNTRDEFPVMPETPDKGSKWLDPDQIALFDPSKNVSIPTQFPALDRALGGGLMLSELTVLSGSNGSGKTTWLNQLILNAVNADWPCALWSGELIGSRLMFWLHLAAAGRGNVYQMPGLTNFYGVSDEVARQIDSWLKGRLFIYNNKYGSRWKQLYSDLQEAIREKGVKLLVVDNLAALELGDGPDKYDKQRLFIGNAAQLAKDTGTHIIIVCHPRKSMAFLRKEDISGTANLTDLADNVIIVHRVNKDFMKRAEEYFGNEDADFIEFRNGRYDNALDLCKTRFMPSTSFSLMGLYFELETRRLKSSIGESVVYGWRQWCSPTFDYNDEFDDLPV